MTHWRKLSRGDLPPDWKQRRRAIFARDGFRCRACGRVGVPLECDHIQPRERGGVHDADNLQTLCRACHIAKTSRDAGFEPVQGQHDWAQFARRRVRRAF